MSATRHELEPATGTIVKVVDATVTEAEFLAPSDACAAVIIVHGKGSSRLSPRNRFVAKLLREQGLATLLLDLETPEEREQSLETGESPVDLIEMADRILLATDWLSHASEASGLSIGYLGAGTGAAAAFLAASQRPDDIRGIVARGGRLELAGDCLPNIRAPALLIVGARDTPVVHRNRDALDRLGSEVKRMEVIPGARHLFEEPGTLAAVAMHSARWFKQHLPVGNLADVPGFAVVAEEK